MASRTFTEYAVNMSSAYEEFAPGKSADLEMNGGMGLFIGVRTGSDDMGVYVLYAYGTPATHRWKQLIAPSSNITMTPRYNKITVANNSANSTVRFFWISFTTRNAKINRTDIS